MLFQATHNQIPRKADLRLGRAENSIPPNEKDNLEFLSLPIEIEHERII